METIRLNELPMIIKEPIDLAHMVAHNDPFNPNDKTIIAIPIGISAYSVLKDFNYDIEFYDIVIAKNQEIIDTDFMVEKDDVLSFSLVPKGGGGGGGKQILSIVAMVAIAVASAGAGSAFGASFAAGFSTATGITMSVAVGTAMISAGVMIAGSLLISALFKPNVPSGTSLESFDNSTTYGWNVQGNSLAQGNTIPILYGTMRITPQYIGKYLKTQNNVQILKALLALGEGQLDSIKFIQINDQDVANYLNVTIETRMGENVQSIINDFNDTWSDQGVNKKLTDTDTWQYATTSGDAVTSFSVGISCPSGLYYANNSGGLDNYSVYLDIEYKAHASNVWLSFKGEVHNVNYYYVDQNPIYPRTNNIRGYANLRQIPIADRVGTFDIYKQSVPWVDEESTILEYVGTTTILPSTATRQIAFPLGSNAYTNGAQMAWTETKQETTVPYFSISAAQTSAIRRAYTASGLLPNQYDVRVRFYSNPTTSSRYASATYFEFLQEAISDDFIYPNTALLGLSIQATDQLSGGLPKVTCLATRITGEYGSLDNPAWACLDLLLNTRYGAGIPIERIDFQSFSSWADFCDTNGYKVNLYLDQSLNLVQSLQLVGQLGRGTVMQYGSTFRALVDRADILPTQGFLFSMGNIIQNSFNESFLPLKDRANIIEVTYYDEENDYTRTVIEVAQGNYDLVGQANKTSIDLLGCTSKEQALKQARYHLNQNRYLTITATWEASIDSIQCQVGDIVNVAHDVPQWGYSGRIISNTANAITVDRNDLIMESGKLYYIQVSDALTDEQIYRKVISITDNNIVHFDITVGDLGEYSVYSFGEVNRHAKKMRVMSISTAGDMKRKIAALEYNENVYNDSVDIPTPIQISDLRTKNLKASEFLEITSDGTIAVVVSLSWSGARLSYKIMYKKASDLSYISAGIAYGNNFYVRGLVDGENYDFIVDGEYLSYFVAGKTTPPPMIENLQSIDTLEYIRLTWDYPYKPIDFKEFIISSNLYSDIKTANKYVELPLTKNNANISIYTIDTTGNRSDTIFINYQVTLLASIAKTHSIYLNNRLRLIWDAITDSRATGFVYEIRRGISWGTAQKISVQSETFFEPINNGTYWISALYTNGYGIRVYSATPYGVTVGGAILSNNIIATFDEVLSGWSGIKDGTIKLDSGDLALSPNSILNIDTIPNIDTVASFDFLSGSILYGIYNFPIEHSLISDQINTYKIHSTYTAFAGSINSLIDTVPNFDLLDNVDEEVSGRFSIVPQISTTLNGVLYSDWANLIDGDYIIMGAKFRILITAQTADILVKITEFILTVDVPDRIEVGTEILVPSIGIYIPYTKMFHDLPNTQITIINAIDGDTYKLTNTTMGGFDISITNSGIPVERQINYISQGY